MGIFPILLVRNRDFLFLNFAMQNVAGKARDLSGIFARFPKAKKIAVENFVDSAAESPALNSANLSYDAKLYGWNYDTVKAIQTALKEGGKL